MPRNWGRRVFPWHSTMNCGDSREGRAGKEFCHTNPVSDRTQDAAAKPHLAPV